IPNLTRLIANRYSKNFYEPRQESIIRLLEKARSRIMMIGTGSGETEKWLSSLGHHVIALPLDLVICTNARRGGVEIINGGMLEALARLSAESFDYVIIQDIL